MMIAQLLTDMASALSGKPMRAISLGVRADRFVPFFPFAVPLLWSSFRLVQSVRRRRWHRAGWYGRLLWTSCYTASFLALWAALQRGLTPNSQEQSCSVAGQGLDELYYYNHHGPLPPLLNSSPCNSNYDLVPAWVNPTIVICLLLATAALAMTVSAWAAGPGIPRERARPDSPVQGVDRS